MDSLDHIRDGWPQRAKSLQEVLDWNDPNADIQDELTLSYVFNMVSGGEDIDVQMDKFDRYSTWPDVERANKGDNTDTSTRPPLNHPAWRAPLAEDENHADSLPEPIMVTNENKDQWVDDYIWWLANKSVDREFQAFARGFFTCFDRKTLKVGSCSVAILIHGNINGLALTQLIDPNTESTPATRRRIARSERRRIGESCRLRWL